MAKIAEHSPQRLVIEQGTTRLMLDKAAGKAVMQRKVLLWNRKPVETDLSAIGSVAVDAAIDHASGVEVCCTMLVMREGAAWAMPAADRTDAESTAGTVRDFLGLA